MKFFTVILGFFAIIASGNKDFDINTLNNDDYSEMDAAVKVLSNDDDKLSISLNFGNDYNEVIILDKMPNVFTKDSIIEIASSSSNEKLFQNLDEFSSNHYWRKPNGNSNWAIFVEKDGQVLNGLFTTNNGEKTFQVNLKQLDENNKRQLRDDSNKHSIKQVTNKEYLDILGNHENGKSRNLQNENQKDNENSNSTFSCGSKEESLPYSQRKGNMGVKINAIDINLPATKLEKTTQQINESPAPGKPIPFFPGCFDTDLVTREFKIGVALDDGYFEYLGRDMSKVANEVENIVSSTRLLYLNQLNILLKVGKIVVGNGNSQFPLDMNPKKNTCVSDINFALSELGKWNAENNDNTSSEMGHWHLLTTCWPPGGIVGVANIASLCDARRNVAITSRISPTTTWYIFAHELGHGFGAHHVFNVGGIMDYGRPYYNGAIQFHPDNKEEMCAELKYRAPTCEYFKIVTVDSKCGNGLLEEGEDCECIDKSKKDCGPCKSCKLNNENIKCSSKDFVMRTRSGDFNKDYISAIPDNLSDNECCSPSGGISESTTTCNNGKDVCVQGKCTEFCSKFNLDSCKMINDGCKQPCSYRGDSKCYEDLKSQTSKTYISWIPDGVSCKKGKGVCSSGECVISS